MLDYKILSSSSTEDLEKLVQFWIKYGWVPQGVVYVPGPASLA